MKRALPIFFLLFTLLSCSKEKQPGIVGTWTEEANYVQDATGNYSWQPASVYPIQLNFHADGKYQWLQFDAMQTDSYQFAPASGEVKLGNASMTLKLSQPDASVLIMDRPVAGEKIRFRKN